jgi:hypothetical protein
MYPRSTLGELARGSLAERFARGETRLFEGAPATRFADQMVLVNRLFESSLGTGDVFTLYLGDRLGFYRALRDNGAGDAQVARAAGGRVNGDRLSSSPVVCARHSSAIGRRQQRPSGAS